MNNASPKSSTKIALGFAMTSASAGLVLAWLATLVLAAGPLHAQTSATPKPSARPSAKPAPKAVGLPAASAEQMAAATIAHLGAYACEFNETVTVNATPKHEGYIDVQHRKAQWTMKPVLSSTGALRLEDVQGRLLMLQIANKSMLMDTKIGQRLVDGCVHEKQREAAGRPAASSLGLDAASAAK